MRILVTGATGNIGRMVVDHLMGQGVTIRALTSNPAKAALPDGVEIVTGYIGNPDSLAGAFNGVDKMYLAPFPETTAEVCAMACDAGVQHIVDLSGEKESHWGEVAIAVEESGVPWTHLSPGEFMENTEIWAEQIKRSDEVRDAYASVASALICMDDIARVAAVVLCQSGHESQEYELTGPETLTREEQVERIGRGLERDLRFVEVSHEEAVKVLEPAMGEYADWYLQLKAELIDGPHEVSTVDVNGNRVNVVEYLTGKRATTLAEWATSNAGQFTTGD